MLEMTTDTNNTSRSSLLMRVAKTESDASFQRYKLLSTSLSGFYGSGPFIFFKKKGKFFNKKRIWYLALFYGFLGAYYMRKKKKRNQKKKNSPFPTL